MQGPKGWIFLAALRWLKVLALAQGLILAGLTAGAQTPPPAEVKDLVQLLSKPELKAWLDAQIALEAQGTVPSTAPAPATDDRSMMSEGLVSVHDYARSLIAAVPTLPDQFRRARATFASDIERWGLAIVAGLVAGFVLVGLSLDWLMHAATSGFRRWMRAQSHVSPRGRVRALAGRLAYSAIMQAVFVLGTVGLFLMFDWPPLLREAVLAYLSAAIVMRATMVLGRATLLPPMLRMPDAIAFRVLPISDAVAQHWYVWTAILVGLFALLRATFDVLARLGIDAAGRHVLLIPAGIVCLLAVLLAIWRRPRADDRAADFRHSLHSWLLTLYCVALMVLAVSGMVMTFWFAVTVVVLPGLIVLCRNAVYYVLRPPPEGSEEPRVMPVMIALVDRGIRVLLILGAAWGLLRISGTDMSAIGMTESFQDRILRAGFNALAVILGADFGWNLIKAFIVHRLEPSSHAPEAEHDAEHARLRTLLPIFQNILFAAIFVVSVLMVLSSFGINIAPLIAGAGVFGVAIGFGAQTVVKDMISGIFYMLDDAFRIGEYIQSGSYKGTVESFSIRSVRLRHHRGPVFTVPFGELGAVQNMSRDWSKDKFLISVPFDTDLEKVRKLSKKVGQELLADPEFGPSFIEPLKMKGVEQFGEYGMSIGFGMMVKPGGQQSMIRRRAYAMIKAAFAANGIDFASPTVQVAGGEGNAAAALGAKAAMDRRALNPDAAE